MYTSTNNGQTVCVLSTKGRLAWWQDQVICNICRVSRYSVVYKSWDKDLARLVIRFWYRNPGLCALEFLCNITEEVPVLVEPHSRPWVQAPCYSSSMMCQSLSSIPLLLSQLLLIEALLFAWLEGWDLRLAHVAGLNLWAELPSQLLLGLIASRIWQGLVSGEFCRRPTCAKLVGAC